MYTITEKGGAAALTPLTGPWGCLGSVRLLSGGCELDNLPSYGRHHEMFGWKCLSHERQYGEAGICGFAGSEIAATGTNVPKMGTIALSTSYTVMHPLHLSLFSSGKMLPTRYAPLEVEISLAPAVDWLDAATSVTYEISNVQLLYDNVACDEAINESYFKALVGGRVCL